MLIFIALSLPGSLWGANAPETGLDRGFRLLYDLRFDAAQHEFSEWKRTHPEDPLGFASEGAGLLFSEFSRLGILEAQFYENDKEFLARRKFNPDPQIRQRFFKSLEQAETVARTNLSKDEHDDNALFAMILVNGLHADYAALIDRSNLSALSYTRQSTQWSERLLKINHTIYDAYLARGFSRYIIGSMSPPVRWLLRLGGIDGNKQGGIEDLKLTAEKGHYLAPFARILLAIAYVRAKNKPEARDLLSSLDREFPDNPLYRKEISHLETAP